MRLGRHRLFSVPLWGSQVGHPLLPSGPCWVGFPKQHPVPTSVPPSIRICWEAALPRSANRNSNLGHLELTAKQRQ